MILPDTSEITWQSSTGADEGWQLRRDFAGALGKPGDIVERIPGWGGTDGLRVEGYPHETQLPLGCHGRAVHLQADPFLPGMVLFSGLCGDPSLPPGLQLQKILGQIEEVLAALGMHPTALVRTWYYIDRILDWYDHFNRIRTRWFHQHGILDGLLPASTGIGAAIHGGFALRIDAIALAPTSGWRWREAVSPEQGPASDYGSSFSRGMVLESESSMGLLVSGTASIDRRGHTLHAGDGAAQIRHTLGVVHAMLRAQGMEWADVTRGVAYFPRGEGRDCLARCLEGMGAAALPIVHTAQTVCRNDLLFELELDAWKVP